MPKKRTMTRKYYATSSAVRYPKLLSLYTEAMSDAQRKLNEKPELEEIYIVQIIATIRRDSKPAEWKDLLDRMKELEREIETRKSSFVVENVE